MIEIKDKKSCSGCSACYNACLKQAITMKEDEKGFKYPVIDKDKCIDCGLCEKVCPITNCVNISNTPRGYACTNKNEEVRKDSSSGGIFSLVADFILDLNGVVFGAAFDDKFKLKHISIEKKEDLYKLRTSKYLQSEIGDTYKEAKELLLKDKYVLFTGTPCQIEGLKAYLGKDYDKLYTQDIICHGVPSPKVWEKYKEYRSKIDNQKPVKINFRNKDNGWHKFNLKFDYSNGKFYSKNQGEDIYMRAFLKDVSLRDSCYKCSFKKYNRISDITLADFWGIESIDEKIDDNKGISFVITNSSKGEELLKKIKDNCNIFKEINLEQALNYNKSFTKSVNMNKYRERFFKDLDNVDFDILVKKYVRKPSIAARTINKAKKVVKKIIKR